MAFIFRPPRRKRRRRILKTKERDLFQRLDKFVQENEPELIRLLETTWVGQGNLLTYGQIQEAYYQGDFTGDIWLAWEQLYSEMILEQMLPLWEAATITAVADISSDFSIPLLTGADFGGDYFRDYGANLVTNMVGSQREALKMTLWELYQNQNLSATQASYFIRPLIGLTTPQIKANARYYENTWQSMVEENPNLTAEQAQTMARTLSEKYAAKQHRYRAQMIARTELTTFFNAGHDLAVDEAISLGLLPDMDCIWSTSANESTCDICSAMEGERVPKGKPFSNGLKFPPVHPHCGCAVMYEPHEDLTEEVDGGIMSVGDSMRENVPKYTIDIDNKVRVDLTPKNYTYDLLPKLDKICIPVEKLTEYSLNMNHERGKHKAYRLKEKLGYDLINYEHLVDNIISNVNKYEAIEKGNLGFGMRYQVIIPMTGPNGQQANVLTSWIDSAESGEMSLTNVYIK